MRIGDMRNASKVHIENWKGGNDLGDLGVDRRILK
jgi:hypothetical protein